MDTLTDFKLGIGLVMKAEQDWRDVGCQINCSASQLPHFVVLSWRRVLDYVVMFGCRSVLSVRFCSASDACNVQCQCTRRLTTKATEQTAELYICAIVSVTAAAMRRFVIDASISAHGSLSTLVTCRHKTQRRRDQRWYELINQCRLSSGACSATQWPQTSSQ